MTTQNTQTKSASRPTHSLCKKVGDGDNAKFIAIGVAWDRNGHGLYCKMNGKQIIEGGFYAFPRNKENQGDQAGQ